MTTSKVNTAFTAGPAKDSVKTYMKTRQQVLEAVRADQASQERPQRLKGKVGVITGVGPELGIGTHAARLFAREGAAHLYLLDFNKAQLEPFAEALGEEYPATTITALSADAASEETISSLIAQVVKEEGHLDFFFANAGIVAPRPKLSQDENEASLQTEIQHGLRRVGQIPGEEFMEVMRVNALNVFLAIKHASPAMAILCPEKGKTVPGGSLILTASVAGLLANAGPIPYSASKAAVRSMAQTAAYELTGQNIRVNAICPGLIETDMTKKMFELAKMGGKEDKMGYINPLLRQGLGSEVAQAALFLASDESSYVNGQAIVVDGGLSASLPYVRSRL